MGWFAIRPAPPQAPNGSLSPTHGEKTGEASRISDQAASTRRRRWAQLGMWALFLLLVVGCSSGRQSTWDPVGTVADKQLELFNVLLWVMVAVFVLVEGALLYAIIRFRRRPRSGIARPDTRQFTPRDHLDHRSDNSSIGSRHLDGIYNI